MGNRAINDVIQLMGKTRTNENPEEIRKQNYVTSRLIHGEDETSR